MSARRPPLARVSLAAASLLAAAILAATSGGMARALETIPDDALQAIFPGADGAGSFEGRPSAAPVYREGRLAGYAFSTAETVGSVGYSGKPVDILAAVDLNGIITGALLRRHEEPILVIGVSDRMLSDYVAAFAGFDLRSGLAEETEAKRRRLPDTISGATVSSAVIRDAILRAGRVIARSRNLLGATAATTGRIDRESYAPAGWSELVADGSVVRRDVRFGELVGRLGTSPAELSAPDPQARFVELHLTLLSPPRIGQNLLGKAAFNRLSAAIGIDDHAVLIAATGLYSFKGTGYVRSGRFDRVQIVQEERTIALTSDGYENVEHVRAAGAPEFREIGRFVVRADSGFDALKPWRLDLMVERASVDGRPLKGVVSVEYRLPDRYRVEPSPAETAETAAADAPLWLAYWRERWGSTAIISAVLVTLTVVLFLQDRLSSHPRAYWSIRHAFLLVTLVWIGWYAGAQLSVVNVITFVHSLMGEFRWEFFLLDPLIFVLWSYVAVTMLFWGRGVFCGWLCPFGALQELLNEGARRLKVPQIEVPFLVHERLWPMKYVIFLGLFAVSLHSTTLAFKGAEIEPFKTAISLAFMREWPFVTYAVALLAAGLFIERFFCRYLCPLGAALAIPARLRMFEWLKRRPQCGRECQICAQRCPVQAIHPIGTINPNECIHCLQCQTLYYDAFVCPPLAQRRKRRERRLALSGGGADLAEEA